MEIKFGLISADSHAAFARDDFTSRMSVSKWGDRIPHVGEGWTFTFDVGHRALALLYMRGLCLMKKGNYLTLTLSTTSFLARGRFRAGITLNL